MSKKGQHIGLYSQTDVVWIAGLLYLKTIAHALKDASSVDDHVSLLYPRKVEADLVEGARDITDAAHAYDFLHKGWQRKTVKTFRRNLRKGVLGTRSLERMVDALGVDVLMPCRHSIGAQFPIPWVGWIPDFQHCRMPEYFTPEDRQARDDQFQRLIDESSHMLVSSQDSYDDLMRCYLIDPEKVSIYRFCTLPDPSWFVPDAVSVVRRFNLPEKFLMFPSQYWKHKNHLNLFRAIRQLKASGLADVTLVLTGHTNDYRDPEYANSLEDFLTTHNLHENVRHVGTLSRIDQIQLIRSAVAVVQPSYFEGWSMLVEDCRALGKRVYLSDIPSHREQRYANAVYFDPDQPDAIAELIRNDWDSLEPGVDLQREEVARQEVKAISARNGVQLMELIQRLRA